MSPNARSVLIAAAGLAAGFGLAALLFLNPFGWHLLGGGGSEEPAVASGQLWTCSMHPQVIQDHPGRCPICGMNLVPLRVEAGSAGAGAHSEAEHGAAEQLWTCPMHPEILEHQPGECPICGMDLVPVRDGGGMIEVPGAPLQGAPYQGASSQGAIVQLEPAVVQTMNVRTAPVTRQDLARRIRTVGYLEYDQERMVTVTTKYAGWVEKVYVNYVGQPVRRGEPLFEIYAPELVQTEQELLSALDFARRMAAAGVF